MQGSPSPLSFPVSEVCHRQQLGFCPLPFSFCSPAAGSASVHCSSGEGSTLGGSTLVGSTAILTGSEAGSRNRTGGDRVPSDVLSHGRAPDNHSSGEANRTHRKVQGSLIGATHEATRGRGGRAPHRNQIKSYHTQVDHSSSTVFPTL